MSMGNGKVRANHQDSSSNRDEIGVGDDALEHEVFDTAVENGANVVPIAAMCDEILASFWGPMREQLLGWRQQQRQGKDMCSFREHEPVGGPASRTET